MSKNKTQPASGGAPGSAEYVPFGEEWQKVVAALPKAKLVEMLRAALVFRASALEAIPTTWLDPLLTGPGATLQGSGGTWGCPGIERLLNGVKQRIADLPNPPR